MGMNAVIQHKEYNDFVDLCEQQMQGCLIDLPLKHYFTPGMYIREVFIPKGIILTSKIHLTTHPYSVSMGELNVLTKNGIVQVKAPFTGISEAGTRRMANCIEDCIWTTFHINEDNCTDIETIEKRLFKDYENPLLKTKKEGLQ